MFAVWDLPKEIRLESFKNIYVYSTQTVFVSGLILSSITFVMNMCFLILLYEKDIIFKVGSLDNLERIIILIPHHLN